MEKLIVMAGYGWPVELRDDSILERPLKLNFEHGAGSLVFRHPLVQTVLE
jgi:hypothetical protein